MNEYRVIVTRDGDGSYRYTLHRRRWVFSIPLWWVQVPPIWQPTYEKAMELKDTSNENGDSCGE